MKAARISIDFMANLWRKVFHSARFSLVAGAIGSARLRLVCFAARELEASEASRNFQNFFEEL
jgi:hypothetical protein